MRHLIPILLCALLLAACNTPSPTFRQAMPTRVTVAGSTFDVRLRGRRAEALRVTPEYAPRFGPIRGRAALAIEAVSGCEVVRLTGDQALAIGHLDCGKGPPPLVIKPVEIECVPVRGSEIREVGQVRIALDCG